MAFAGVVVGFDQVAIVTDEIPTTDDKIALIFVDRAR